MNLRKTDDGRQSVSWWSEVNSLKEKDRRKRTINREKASMWRRAV